MSATHTPGPWHTGGDESRYVYDAGGKHVATAFVCHQRTVVDRSEQNARLIAAAPELLAALQAFVALADMAPDVRLHEEAVSLALSAARGLIAEAKGACGASDGAPCVS